MGSSGVKKVVNRAEKVFRDTPILKDAVKGAKDKPGGTFGRLTSAVISGGGSEVTRKLAKTGANLVGFDDKEQEKIAGYSDLLGLGLEAAGDKFVDQPARDAAAADALEQEQKTNERKALEAFKREKSDEKVREAASDTLRRRKAEQRRRSKKGRSSTILSETIGSTSLIGL